MQPLDDRVLVKPDEAAKMSAGGIVLPGSTKDTSPSQEGTVIAVGPGAHLNDSTRGPMEVKPGDRVLFSRYGGPIVEVDGTEHKIMKEKEIFGIFS